MEVLDVTEGACPALEWDSEAGRYWCGLIRNASQHVPALNGKPWTDAVMREMILETGAFGRACDSDD